MPPKTRKPAKKTAAAAKKAPAKPVRAAEVATAAKATIQHGQVRAASGSNSNKRRAESVAAEEEHVSKKPKANLDQPSNAPEVVNAVDEGAVKEPRELEASLKEKFELMRITLSDHTLRSMGALMDAISFTEARPETVEEMVEAVVTKLEERALDGEDISKEIAAFEKIDQNHWDGEYDSDPEGLEKDVRRRLNKVEDIVGRLTSYYLKDIIKELHFYGRGGTNAALAAEIVAVLSYKAKEGNKIKREYRIVKSVYSMCYGCCGDDSGLDAEGDLESEDDKEEDNEEEDDDEF